MLCFARFSEQLKTAGCLALFASAGFFSLTGSAGAAVDDCSAASAASGLPTVIAGTDLPYDQIVDSSSATDTGDFRGTSADGISSDGGRDLFWRFEPTQSGIYSFTVTAGSSAGIGVWEGSCGALTEVGTAFNLMGAGTSALSATVSSGSVYYIVWEDFFPGSLEDSVRLQVDGPFNPEGETAATAIDLSAESWAEGFAYAADNTGNGNALTFPDEDCDPELSVGGGHGGGGEDGNDVWFKLPPVSDQYPCMLEGLAGTMTNSLFVLYSHALDGEDVGDLVIEACHDDKNNSGGHEANDFMSLIAFTGDRTRQYYLFVESYSLSAGGGNGSFVLEGTASGAEVVEHIENFTQAGFHVPTFIDVAGTNNETPALTLATGEAQRFDLGLDEGAWGGYVTTGTMYLYAYTGSDFLTSPSAITGYLNISATDEDETGDYFYTRFPSSPLDLTDGATQLRWVTRYGGSASTTTTLRLLVRSNAIWGAAPRGSWLLSESFEISGLTGSFGDTPVQTLNQLHALGWSRIEGADEPALDLLADGDEAAIAPGVQTLTSAETNLALGNIDGFGFYIAADLVPSGGFVNGVFFDSIALQGVRATVPVSAVQSWELYGE